MVILAGADIFHLLAQVSAGGVRVFYDHRIRQTVERLVPLFCNQLGRAQRGHNRDYRHIRSMGGQFRQAQRKSGATDDHLGAPLDGGFDQLFVVGQRYHHVYADDPVRSDFIGLAEFILEGLGIGLEIVFAVIELAVETDTGCGHQPNASALGNMSGKTTGGYSHSHATLDNRVAGSVFTDLQLLCHYQPPR